MGRTFRYVAAATVVVVFLAATLWLRSMNSGAGMAFADVQKALERIETAIIDVKYPKTPEHNQKMYVARAHNAVRKEAGTITFILDCNLGRTLVLNDKSKTARIQTDESLKVDFKKHTREMFDKYTRIDAEAIERLGTKKFDGQTLVGFRMQTPDKNLRQVVWVDPKNRLPVRAEDTAVDPTLPGATSIETVYTFTFNTRLDPKLFGTVPPKGYKIVEDVTLTKEDHLPPAPKDKELASPVLEALVGIGRARFGMSVDEVIALLGKPDRRSPFWDNPPERQRAIDQVLQEAKEKSYNEDETIRRLEAVLKKFPVDAGNRPPDGVDLDYNARGFHLKVANDEGLLAVNCLSDWHDARDFSGRTSKGIRIGSTLADLEKAYGPPSLSKTGAGELRSFHCVEYNPLGLSFVLKDGRVTQITLVSQAAAQRRVKSKGNL